MPKTIQVNAAPHPRWRDSGANDNQLHLRKGYRVLSIEDVEKRVHKAIKTLYALPEPWTMPKVRSGMPEYVREFVESYGSDGATSAMHLGSRVVPDNKAIDDMLPTLDLCRCLDRDEYKLLEARVFGTSFEMIGRRRGYSGEYWRLKYRSLLCKLTDIYNAAAQRGVL